jgi:predicted AAA+ superfamily ATPase
MVTQFNKIKSGLSPFNRHFLYINSISNIVGVEIYLNNVTIKIDMVSKSLIEDFFFRSFEFRGIKRDLKIGESEKIISIVGPRRAGKTWFFYSILPNYKDPMYVNFEDIAFRNMQAEEFFEVIKIFIELKYVPKTLFLDEVQVVQNWETLIRSLYDRGYKIFVTGSSSKLLSREIATSLRGRTFTYHLLPFSFREFLISKNENIEVHTYEQQGRILKLLKEYMDYGSYPEVVFSENKDRILREYYIEIFYKDFLERHRIKSIDFGKFLFEFAFQNFSEEMSLRKIKKFFGRNISDSTLYDYANKLMDTLSVFFLDKYSPSVYKRNSWPKKIYVCDTGISKILEHSINIGRKMENVVYLALLRGVNNNPLRSIYFYKSKVGDEVDFLVKEGSNIDCIQVTYASGKDEVDQRELHALGKVDDELKCNKKTVITWDYEEDGNVNFIPLWKWLLRIC